MFITASPLGSVTNLSFTSQLFFTTTNDICCSINLSPPSSSPSLVLKRPCLLQKPQCNTRVSVSSNGIATEEEVSEKSQEKGDGEDSVAAETKLVARRSADWKAARAYRASRAIYEGRVELSNSGGLMVRFYSLLGFLPYPLLAPSHSCKEPHKSIQEIGKDLVGSTISVKVVEASEEKKKLIFSEREAVWSKYSGKINVGDVFSARVGTLEDYGAFVHLQFPDGNYHITGLIHISEVSWDLVQDVRDVLNEGDEVRVKVIQLDRVKSRVALSIKQLEADPLLETLDKVIPELQNGQFQTNSSHTPDTSNIEPLPGLASICKELLQEYGITDVRITRQGFEKRVVSQDLQLWLSNEPAVGNQFTLLARAGRQVQEIELTTTLNQEGIKKALQRVLERVP